MNDRLGIIIIGADGHGKNTLARAIASLTGINCVIVNSKDLIDISRKQSESENLVTESIINDDSVLYKDDNTKSWKRTKFYQK